MRPPEIVTPPAFPPEALADVKRGLGVTHSADDDRLSLLLQAANDYLDGYYGRLKRCILEQRWRQVFAGFAGDRMALRPGPLRSIVSVTYRDAADAEQTLAETVYGPLYVAGDAYVALKVGQAWPTTYLREDAVTVTWTAGLTATWAGVPAALKSAMILHVRAHYDAVTDREARLREIDELVSGYMVRRL